MHLSEPFCLSTHGSTRATAYNWSNKIVTRDGKTHVVWLDAVATICGRTFDHATGQWGDTVLIDTGADNHANPSLTMDAAGRLRLCYGPHGFDGEWNHGRVRWRQARSPGTFAGDWERVEDVGYNATGASLVHSAQGQDVLVCRGGERPPQTMFHRQREQGGWTSARPLMHQTIEPQYTHHYAHVAAASDGTLYVACHFYNVGGGDNRAAGGDQSRMRSYGAAVLKSTDLGETWTDLRGAPVQTPTVYEHRIAIPPLDAYIYVDGLVLDGSGTPWALTLHPGTADRAIYISHWTATGWETHRAEDALPAGRIAVGGMLTMDSRGRLYLAVSAAIEGPEPRRPAHPTCDIFLLRSDDGGANWDCRQVSRTDDQAPRWLPNLSLPGPHHAVEQPVLLYTHGVAGEGCSPTDPTDVYCVRVLD
jgi:hypothetical protein